MDKRVPKNCNQVIKFLAMKVAERDANASCPFLCYQPKLPEAVKKLRKF